MKKMFFVENLELFNLGWHRESAVVMGNAGCPSWLIKMRCHVPSAELVNSLIKGIEFHGTLYRLMTEVWEDKSNDETD